MGWWTKKKSQSVVEEQKLVRSRERGAMLLEDLIKCCDGKSNPIKIFSAVQIFKATSNLCKCNISQYDTNVWLICNCTRVSGLSAYGSWCSGMLDNHCMILVKKFMYRKHDYPRKLCRDIAISSMVSGHKNFMKLVGCCLETKIPFMVYYGEEKQYSTIDLETVVSWKRRMKIVEDIAIALAYLHTAFPRPFVYANMNLRNILLDENGVAKLSDFAYCVSIPEGETFVKLRYGGGAYDYIDDNYMINGVVSEKTDAFGIGILMQKLLLGEETFRELYGHNLDWNRLEKKIPKWLPKSIGEGRIVEIVDPKMLENMGEIEEEERCRMEAFLVLSQRCMGARGEVPTMVEVAKGLKRILITSSSSSSTETQIDSSLASLPLSFPQIRR